MGKVFINSEKTHSGIVKRNLQGNEIFMADSGRGDLVFHLLTRIFRKHKDKRFCRAKGIDEQHIFIVGMGIDFRFRPVDNHVNKLMTTVLGICCVECVNPKLSFFHFGQIFRRQKASYSR